MKKIKSGYKLWFSFNLYSHYILDRNLSGNMKFLILFAVAAVFGSIQCDQECFRAIFKECMREPVPLDRYTLCDELKYEIDCIARFANKCNMPFKGEVGNLNSGLKRICNVEDIKTWYDKEQPCYKKSVNDVQCDAPILAVMKDVKSTEEAILANKKICNLFKPYTDCVEDKVLDNCGGGARVMFNWILRPLQRLSASLCEQLIIPADEKDSRPDNFGVFNVYANVLTMFELSS